MNIDQVIHVLAALARAELLHGRLAAGRQLLEAAADEQLYVFCFLIVELHQVRLLVLHAVLQQDGVVVYCDTINTSGDG